MRTPLLRRRGCARAEYCFWFKYSMGEAFRYTRRVAESSLPRAYFQDVLDELDKLPEGLSSASGEPRTLLLSKASRAHRHAARMCFRALSGLRGSSMQSGWSEAPEHGRGVDGASFWIEAEPEIALPGDLVGMPDIALWQTPARGVPDEQMLRALKRTPPSLCCKVVTAEAVKAYRSFKIALYARAGVRWFWLVDPALQTVEVFSMVPEQQLSVIIARENDERPLPPFKQSIAFAPFWMT